MIQNEQEIVLFGGETGAIDFDQTYSLRQSGTSMHFRETGKLPEPCAPACTSYVLN